jgi:hypothetical protein
MNQYISEEHMCYLFNCDMFLAWNYNTHLVESIHHDIYIIMAYHVQRQTPYKVYGDTFPWM